jgi:hypothetical protein
VLNDKNEIIFLKVSRSNELNATIIGICNLNAPLQDDPDGLLARLSWPSEWQQDSKRAKCTFVCHNEGLSWPLDIEIINNNKPEVSLHIEPGTPYRREDMHSSWHQHGVSETVLQDADFADRIEQLKYTYQNHYQLSTEAIVRYWGLCSYRSIQAIHITLHPRDMIEYISQANEESFVLFSQSSTTEESALNEDTAFDWVDNKGKLPERVTDSILIKPWLFVIEKLDSVRGLLSPDSDYWENTAAINIKMLCIQLLYLYTTRALYSDWPLSTVTDLITRITGQRFELGSDFQKIVDDVRDSQSESDALNTIQDLIETASGLVSLSPETCQICGKKIQWGGEYLAICSEGHSFGKSQAISVIQQLILVDRCSLTLLTIQEPGLSKFCQSCNREYLNEKVVFKDMDTDLPLFGRFLGKFFKTFQQCVHCNGHLYAFS